MLDEVETALNESLLAAHRCGDGAALVDLYCRAADMAETSDDVDRACFFLVQAYVYALENGHSLAGTIRERLRRHGREE